MKCMSKKTLASKRRFEAQQGQIRWNNLSPEEREKEIAERKRASRRLQRFSSDLGAFASAISNCCFGERYTK